MQLVFLDTMIVSWGIVRSDEGYSHQEKIWIPRVRSLLRILESRKISVAISAVVASELLASFPEPEHEDFIQKLYRSYRVYPYDAKAAASFARIWRAKEMDKTIADTLDPLSGITKRKIKADCMIVATAVANYGDLLVSTDNKLALFAKDHIRVGNLDCEPSEYFHDHRSDTTGQQGKLF